MNSPTDLINTIIVSEKATRLTDERNQYVFHVHRNASKPQIAKAIEVLFKTKVAGVRTLKTPGKIRRANTKYAGHSGSWKKAVVQLADGEKIDLA